MAHFAKLSESNEVLAVLTVNNFDILDTNGQESEEKGIEMLTNIHGWTHWKQTSYNTRKGMHYQQDNNTLSEDQSKAFRGNFASIGMIYDTEHNVFREPTTQYLGWVLNANKGVYEPPVERPSENHYWDNNTQSWVVI